MLRKIFSLIFLYVKSKAQPSSIKRLGVLSFVLILKPLLFAQDTTPPGVTITSMNLATSNPAIDFAVTFSETTAGFTQSNLTIANGTINSLSPPSITYAYKSTIGTTGTAGTSNLLLNGPSGIAVTPNGDLMIVDRNNHRIQVFNSTGIFQSTIGSSAMALSDNTGFNAPRDIALDSHGNIYIVDQNNNRIQVYSQSFIYQSSIGTTIAVADNTGFDSPFAIAIDHSDNLYISDANNHRVQVYDNTLSYVTTIGIGAAVNDNTGFNSPRGVAVNAVGNVYVADLLNQRVQIFGSGPTYNYMNTLSGLVFPSGVAVKDNGELFVTEQLAHRLLVYDENLSQIGSVVDGVGSGTGSGSDNNQLNSPADVTLGSTGEIFIADPGNQRIQIFDTSETYTVSTTAVAEGEVILSVPAMVTTDAAGNPNLQGIATVNYDITAPIPSISTFENNPTNASNFKIKIEFSEAINNFSTNDIIVGNGSISNFLFPSELYRFDRTLPNTLTGLSLGFLDVVAGDNSLSYALDDNNTIVHILDNQGNSTGTFGENQLSSPRALTVDSQGSIYVVDDSNSEAYKYDSNGTFLNQFGSNELSSPQEIAVDSQGNVYIVDDGNSEVHRYNSSLIFQGSFGNDQLNSPVGIAIDNLGNKYILDGSNDFVAIYDDNDEFTRSFPIDTNPHYQDMVLNNQGDLVLLMDNPHLAAIYDISGNIIGTFGSSDLDSSPRGMGLDNFGNLFITGNSSNEIDIFSPPTNGYVSTITSANDGVLTVDVPAAAVSDIAGNLSTAAAQFSITVDQTAPSVVLSTSEVSPTSAPFITVTGQFSESVTDLTIDDFTVDNGSKSNFVMNSGSIYSVDITPISDGTVTIDISADAGFDLAGNGNMVANQLSIVSDRFMPTVELISSVGNMTNESPISVVATFSEEVTGFDLADIVVTNGSATGFQVLPSDYTFIGTIGGSIGSGILQMRNPRAVGIDQDGNIYICDQSNHRIQIFDANRNYIATIGVSGISQVDNTGFHSPAGIAIDAGGNIYISDQNNHRIQIYDSNRNYISTIGTSGQTQSDNSGFNFPTGIALDQSGNIYVSDQNNHRIQVFDSNGNYAATVGVSGQETNDNTGFNFPNDVAIDENENIYVIDRNNHRVQMFDSNRNYIATLGTSGVEKSDNTGFNFPTDITIDLTGNIYITDSGNNRIQVYDSKRNYTSTTGTPGQSQPDIDGVMFANGAATDSFGNIYISDSHGRRIQIYQPPKPAYTFSITPLVEGAVTVDIAAGAFNDTFGKSNALGEQLTINYDISPPIAIFQGPIGFNSISPFTVILTFNEQVSRLDQMAISTFSGTSGGFNATLNSFTQIDNLTYEIEITPDGSQKNIELLVINNSVLDETGNANLTIKHSIPFDLAGPVLDILGEPATINSTTPFNLTFEFNKNVIGFELEDLTVTNGMLSNFISVDANTFTADLTPNANGDVIIFLADGLVEGEVGNLNSASFPVTILLDNVGPSMSMSTGQNPTNSSTFDTFVTFDERVIDFDENDLTVTNGAVTSLTAPTGEYTFLSSIGSSGSGEGQIDNPEDIVIDNIGNIYVVESENHRIQVFDGDGNFVSTFGSQGTGNDQFSSPKGIDIGPNGLIYIADQSNHRIQIYDAAFTYIHTIGSFGSGSDQLNNPADVYTDDFGTVYIADKDNNRIQVFDSDYNYVRTIGSFGLDPGLFLRPSGVTVDLSGNIYTVESTSNSSRVQVFNNNGNILHTLGSLGSTNGNFRSPEGIFVDNNGTVYVADTRNSRIEVFDRHLQYVTTIGGFTDEGNDELDEPTAVLINSNGDLVIADSRNDRIQTYSPPLEIYTATITATTEGLVEVSVGANSLTDLAGNSNQLGATISVLVDITPPAVVLTPIASKVNAPFEVTAQFTEEVTGVTPGDFLIGNGIVSNLNSIDGSTYTITVSPIKEGSVSLDMNASSAVDLAGNGNIAGNQVIVAFDQSPPSVVLSTAEVSPSTNQAFDINIDFSEEITGFDQSSITVENGNILSLTPPNNNYAYISTIGTAGSVQMDNSGFNTPQSVATDQSGRIFIVDRSNQRIQIYDSNRAYLATIGTTGQNQTDNSGFTNPTSITADLNGHIYVVDPGNHRIQIFDNNFTYLNTLGVSGVSGNDNQHFDTPGDVAVDALGNIYVADSGNRRVQVYNSSLTHLFTIDQGNDPSDIFGSIAAIMLVHVDLSGNIYITDNFRERIQIFDVLGNYTGQIGTTDQPQTDNTGFSAPLHVSTDVAGNIYVADSGNERIQVFRPNRAYLTTIGTVGVSQTNNSGFATNVSDVTLGINNLLYIADPTNHRIQVYELPTNTYHATIQAIADGPVTARVDSGVATDAGGSINTSSNLLSVTVDINPPSVSITSLTGSTVNMAFTANIQFSESVTGFDIQDVIAGNATLSNFITVDTDSYTVLVTPVAAGQITLDVSADVVQDIIGNDNTVALQFSRTFDPSSFTSTITSVSALSVNSGFDVDIDFGRRTSTMMIGDISVNNGTTSNFIPAATNRSYSSTISTGDNNVISPFGVAINSQGDIFVSGNSRIEVYDATGTLINNIGTGAPSSQQGEFNDPRDIAFDASGRLYVVDRLNHRVQVFNGTDFSFQQEFGSRGSANNEFEFPNGIAIAPNGNIFIADKSNERIQIFNASFNYIATLGTTLTQGNTNTHLRRPSDVYVDNNGRIYVADTNNDRIQIFESDLTYAGTIGTGSAGTANDELNNPSGVFVDGFGDIYVVDQSNHRIQIFSSNLLYTTTLGTSISGGGNDAFNNPVSVVLNALGSHLYVSDQSNNRVQVFAINQSAVTATVTPINEGTVAINVDNAVVTDGIGSPNVSSSVLQFMYDITPPIIDIFSIPIVTNNSTFLVGFEVNNETIITGIDLTDIVITNGVPTNLVIVDDTRFSVEVTPDGGGDISIEIPTGMIDDLAGNTNVALSPVVVPYDIIPPTLIVSSMATNPTNDNPILISFSFSEDITGFDETDVIITNGIISSFSGSGATYFATLAPIADGELTVNVAANAGVDIANNGSTIAAEFSIESDRTNPTISLFSILAGTNNRTSIPIDFSFSETISGFSDNDIMIENGSLSNSGLTSFTVTPLDQGQLTVTIPQASFFDAAGNGNISSSIVFTIDYTSPTLIDITTPVGSPNNLSTFPVFLTFSEAMGVGFSQSDIMVNNGTTSTFNNLGTSQVYQIDINPISDGPVTISIPDGIVFDVAGNTLTGATPITIDSDRTGPVLSITTPMTTNSNGFTASINVNEPTLDFEDNDIDVSNGTVLNFSGSGTLYTVDILPNGGGDISLFVPDAVLTDILGNPNTVSNSVVVTLDDVAPTVSLSTTANDPTNQTVLPISITFSEQISGLEISDFLITNATASNLNGTATNYTMDLSTIADGSITVQLAAQSVLDLAGNGNVVSNLISVISDQTAPSVTLTSSSSNPTNQDSFQLSVNFTENVVGFDALDIGTVNGIVSNFSGTNDTYSATITSTTTDGIVSISIPEHITNDAAGNLNTSSNTLAVTVDMVRPSLTISSPSFTNVNVFTASFDFDEPVVGFTEMDISIVNASISNFIGTGTSYTADITPNSNGIITIDVAEDAAMDVAGNTSMAAIRASIDSDFIAPSLVISTTENSPTNLSTIPITLTFSEDVAGLLLNEITINNGSTANLIAISNSVYTIDVIPDMDGLVTVDVGAGVVSDNAGNDNIPATQLSIISDQTPPTVVISSTAGNPSNNISLPITITFSESVTGFIESDLILSNGLITNFTGAGTTYTLDLEPIADGLMTLEIAAGVAVDNAVNSNTVSNQFSSISDRTSPTVVISSNLSSPTSASPIPITITFSESVTGFNEADLTFVNGVISNFAGSGSSFTLDIEPISDGNVSIEVAAGVALDEATNENVSSNQLSINSDRTSPTVAITSTTTDPTNSNSIPVTITFNEPVTGFIESDLTLGNCLVSNFVDTGSSYTLDLEPIADGIVTLGVAAGLANDAAMNANTASNELSIVSDRTAPTVSISSTTSSPTNSSSIPVTITFSESVTGFTQSDLILSNGVMSNFTGIGSSYSLDLEPIVDGILTLEVMNGVVEDNAMNSNLASNQFSIVSDQTVPTVSISSTAPVNTNSISIPVTITFSESVTGFAQSDITLDNGVVTNFTGSGSSYTLNLEPISDGLISLEVAAGVAEDDATNSNLASNELSINSDRTAPTVTIVSSTNGPTNVSSIPVTITFSEPISGFTESDLTLSNGIVSNFIGSGSNYTLDVEPILDGLMTLEVVAGEVEDEALNSNLASNQLSIMSDRTAPTVSISSATSSPTNSSSIAIVITFSEPVLGFSQSDLTISNGMVSNFAGSGSSYTFNIEPISDGSVTIAITADVTEDDAMNTNLASNQLDIVSDRSAPTVSVSSSTSSSTNASSIPVSISFSEPVTGFSLNDIALDNGSISNFTGSGSFYILDLEPDADGLVTLNIAAGVAEDDANNGNMVSSQFSFISDRTKPTVVLSTTIIGPTNVDIIPVAISFSESVTGFTESGLTVNNGIINNLQGTGDTYTIDVEPTTDGNISVDVLDGAAFDASGNSSIASVQLLIESDKTSPTITISTTTDPTNESIIPLTINFSEPVTGFAISDLMLTNAVSSNFMGSGATYTVDITSTIESGILTVEISTNAAMDMAGNPNTLSSQLNIAFDAVAPNVLEISRMDNNPITGTTARYLVGFSENVEGIEVSDFDLAVTGSLTASIASVSSNSGMEIIVMIDNINGNGNFELSIPDPMSMSDAAGNHLSMGFTGESYTTNVAPNDILLSSSSIAENNAIDAVIGNLSTEDGNSSDTHSYAFVSGIGDTNNGDFNILGNELRASLIFDFESQSSYSIRIETTDEFGQTFQKSFDISVTNIGEPQIRLEGTLEFQSVEIGSSETLNFEIHNDGDGDLTVSEILYPAGFSGNLSSTIVTSTGLQTIQVTFSPTEEISYSGEITLQSDAGSAGIMATGAGQLTTAIEIDPESFLSETNIYPNPASNTVTIDLSGYSKSVDILIRNIDGKMLFEQYDFSEDLLEINTSGFQQGMYFISLNSEKETIVRKLMIKR